MDGSHGRPQQHGYYSGDFLLKPCRYCVQDAEFSREIGDTDEANEYEQKANAGRCMHSPTSRWRILFREWEALLPRTLRLDADPPGRRPRGPSHLTLAHYLLDPISGELTELLVPPAWPAYGSAYIRETQREPSHHAASHAHGPSSAGSGIRNHAERSWLKKGRVGHSRDYHLDELSEYESSSPDDRGSDPETSPSVDLETPSLLESERPNFTSGIRERSGMGGRVAWEEYDG